MSLPELDRHLGFAPNKMRSLKAIMAKLENRFGLRFLVADPEGGLDENGNPRAVLNALKDGPGLVLLGENGKPR